MVNSSLLAWLMMDMRALIARVIDVGINVDGGRCWID